MHKPRNPRSKAFLRRATNGLDCFPQGSGVVVLKSFGGVMTQNIEARLADLPELSRTSLCNLWNEHFGTSPAVAQGRQVTRDAGARSEKQFGLPPLPRVEMRSLLQMPRGSRIP